jgi:hypothetical protein
MGTPSLREIQGLFFEAIATRPGALTAAPKLLAVTAPSRTLDAAARLRVYADAYFWRLRDVLAEDFPRLAAHLGAERFAALASDYLRHHPSAHPSLRHLGDRLSDFAGRALPDAPYLADLARLERARVDVFDAGDDPPLSVAALRAVDPGVWPALRFVPIRALHVLRLDWPVLALWDDRSAAPAAPATNHVRVWRGEDYRVFHGQLEPRAARALECLVAGEPFEQICAVFGDLAPEEGARLATALLARWIEDGLIARLA